MTMRWMCLPKERQIQCGFALRTAGGPGIVAAESFGAALQYFSGSQAHNIAIRQIGRRNGLKINEYGVFKFEERVAGDSEASVYQAIGLAWVHRSCVKIRAKSKPPRPAPFRN